MEDQAFSRSYDPTARLPPPPLPIARQKAQQATHGKIGKEKQAADRKGGKGVGEEPNHTTTRKPGPLYTIQYSLSDLHRTGSNRLASKSVLGRSGEIEEGRFEPVHFRHKINDKIER